MSDEYIERVNHGSDETAVAAFDRVRARLFDYDIFPASLVRFALCPAGPVRQDTLIVQRVGIGPMRLESAVRVVEVWDTTTDGSRDAGFRYVTLSGHPERGVASFGVQMDSSGDVLLTLGARSQAGTLLTRLGRPVARRVQTSATKAAIQRMSAPLKGH